MDTRFIHTSITNDTQKKATEQWQNYEYTLYNSM